MEELYNNWKQRPSPQRMGVLLQAADPVLQSAIQSYGSGNKALYGRARYLAAKAIESYDPRKGTQLRTHLMTQLQPLNRYNKSFTQVTHVPERVSMDLYRLNQEKSKYTDQHGREPSDREVADLTGMSLRRIGKIRGFAKGDMSESSLTEMDEGEQALMYPGVHKVDPKQVWLEYVHHDLDPVGQQILEWKTGYNGKEILSNNDIAKRLKLSAGAISQRSALIAARINEGAGGGV